MADPLLVAVAASICTACVLSYLLGHYRGFEAGLECARPPLPSDWGERPEVPVIHGPGVTDAAA